MALVRGRLHQKSESFQQPEDTCRLGQTGNAGGGTSLSVPQLSSLDCMYYVMAGGSMMNAAGIAQQKEIDTNLKWETNEQTNIGLDMAFMNNELSFSVDYFIRDSKDLLIYRQIRPSTGFTSVYTNAGHIRNKGFEISAAWNKSFGDWNVGVRVNGSTLKNEAVEVGDPIFYKTTVLVVRRMVMTGIIIPSHRTVMP